MSLLVPHSIRRVSYSREQGNLGRGSAIVNMVVLPCESGRSVMKSRAMLDQGVGVWLWVAVDPPEVV